MYCYPFGLNVTYERKLSAVSKQSKFDVKTFKGQYDKKPITTKRIIKKFNDITKLKQTVLFLFDTLTLKKIKVLEDEE